MYEMESSLMLDFIEESRMSMRETAYEMRAEQDELRSCSSRLGQYEKLFWIIIFLVVEKM